MFEGARRSAEAQAAVMPPPPVDTAPAGPLPAGSLSFCRPMFVGYSLAWGGAALAILLRTELTGTGTSDGLFPSLWLGVLLISLISNAAALLGKAKRWATVEDHDPEAFEPRLRTLRTRLFWSAPVIAIGLVGALGPWWSDNVALVLSFGLLNPAGQAVGNLLAVLWIEHRRGRRVASQRLGRFRAHYRYIESAA